MNIVVYCGCSQGTPEKYNVAARQLGHWIGESGHTLVYGGCRTGLMGVVADATAEAGGKIIGILPDIERIQQKKYLGEMEEIQVSDLSERRKVMIEMGDAFVALPGGVGTLDEISEVFALIRLNVIDGRSVLVDTDGYYQPLKQQFANMIEDGFLGEGEPTGLLISGDIDEIGAYLSK